MFKLMGKNIITILRLSGSMYKATKTLNKQPVHPQSDQHFCHCINRTLDESMGESFQD